MNVKSDNNKKQYELLSITVWYFPRLAVELFLANSPPISPLNIKEVQPGGVRADYERSETTSVQRSRSKTVRRGNE